MYTLFLILLGSAGLGLGMANPFLHIPLLALLYPVSLAALGYAAPKPGNALRHGWICGLAASTAGLYWIALPVHEFGYLPWVLAVPCAVAVAAYVGFYGGLFALGAHLMRDFSCTLRAVGLGLLWLLLEWLRGTLFTGFPWLNLASAFSPWPAWIQGASIIGAYGLAGLYVGLACLGFASLPGFAPQERTGWARQTPSGGGTVWTLVTCLAGLTLVVGFGLWRLERSPLQAGPPVAVALIQGNVEQDQKWSPSVQESTLDRYLELSATALRQTPTPTLLIWPETAMPFRYDKSPALTARIRLFARQNNVGLILGTLSESTTSDEAETRTLGGSTPAELSGEAPKLYNRAMMVGPLGEAGWYDKLHLVPFGEYAPPWLDLPFLRPLLQGVGYFTPGTPRGPLALRLTAAGENGEGQLVPGLLICYETIFPALAQERVAEGADVLINISNDAWFGRSSAPEQHLQSGLLRAVEQGRYLARSTNTGISAFVDPYGRLLGQSSLFLTEVLNNEIRPIREHTPYFYCAPYLIPAAAALLLLTVCVGMAGGAPRRFRR